MGFQFEKRVVCQIWRSDACCHFRYFAHANNDGGKIEGSQDLTLTKYPASRRLVRQLCLWALPVFMAGLSRAAEDQPGVKVVSVEKESAAARAGLQAGDIVSGWTQGRMTGAITDAFYFDFLARERAPRGSLTLTGLRSGKAASWTISNDDWKTRTIPVLPGVQTVIDHLNDLAKAKRFADLDAYCRQACLTLDGQSEARSFALFEAGRLLASANQLPQAAFFFNQSLEERPRKRTWIAVDIYVTWADLCDKFHDWPSAERLYLKGLAESEQLGPLSLTEGICLEDLGALKFQTGKFTESQRFNARALSVIKTFAPESVAITTLMGQMGAAAGEAGDLDLSESYFKKQLLLALNLKLPDPYVARIYNNLGVTAATREDFTQAEKYFLHALDLASKASSGVSTSHVWGNLSNVAQEEGKLALAEYYMRRSISLHESQGAAGEIDLAYDLATLASLKLDAGDAAAAIQLAQRARPILERLIPNTRNFVELLLTYGNALRKQGELQPAQEIMTRALTVANNINPRGRFAAQARFDLGQVYADEGNLTQALDQHRIAEEIRKQISPMALWEAKSLGAMAVIEERLGRPELAMEHYSQSIEIFDKQRSNLARADSLAFDRVYPDYSARFAALLLDRQQTVRAFELVDHSRARTLAGTLSENHVKLLSGISPALLAKDRKLEMALSDLAEERIRVLTEQKGKGLPDIDKKIAAATAEHDVVESQMRLSNPRYGALTQQKLPALAQIQAALGIDTVLLEYCIRREHSYVFAVDRRRIRSFELSAGTQLNKLALATYQLWSKRNPKSEAQATAEQLSEAALASVADFIKGHKRLLLVTDGGLQYIPFAALPLPKSFGTPGLPVASQFEVVSLPSASLLLMLRQNPSPVSPHARYTIAVLGDPVFTRDDPRLQDAVQNRAVPLSAARGGEFLGPDNAESASVAVTGEHASQRGLRLNRLIHSREEAEAIASVTPHNHLLMALDFDANRTTALDPKVTHSRIIHFATHGIFDSESPAMSGLVLSLVDKQGNPQNGFLGLNEIYGSHISAHLVVASACESALGEAVNSEGLVGLTWGFIYAGAKSVVASLWQVNDASTAELMRVFYEGMERQGLTPAAALRRAQITISRKPEWSAPYYWAGFVIEGEYAK